MDRASYKMILSEEVIVKRFVVNNVIIYYKRIIYSNVLMLSAS